MLEGGKEQGKFFCNSVVWVRAESRPGCTGAHRMAYCRKAIFSLAERARVVRCVGDDVGHQPYAASATSSPRILRKRSSFVVL